MLPRYSINDNRKEATQECVKATQLYEILQPLNEVEAI